MQPGWTYLFEAVYGDNTHVVQYAFEGLVLLAAVKPDGQELRGVTERQHLAAQLGVMAVPSLQGPWAELCDRLSRGTPQNVGGGSAVPAAFEGWVVEEPRGTRHKLVQAAFQRTGRAAQLLHPLTVWDKVRNSCTSRAQLSAGLPPHFQCELHAILDAMEDHFCRVLRYLAHMAAQANSQQSQGRLCELMDGMQGFLADRGGQVMELENMLASLTLEEGRESSGCSAEGVQNRGAVKALHSSDSFQKALHYVLQHTGGRVEAPMFWRRISHIEAPGSLPLLRGLVLDCIRPGMDGTLPGYSPSPNFAQTHAKGWARNGPADTNMALASRAHQAWGEGSAAEILLGVISQLSYERLNGVQLVCKEWQRVISCDAVCKEKMKDWIAAAEMERLELSYSRGGYRSMSGYGSF
jgi:hypothetical protein